MQACNELIIKSVDFLLKIFNIVITFEHVYLTKNEWKPFKKKITNNKNKNQNAKKKKKTTCIEMYNDQTQTYIILYEGHLHSIFDTQRGALVYRKSR